MAEPARRVSYLAVAEARVLEPRAKAVKLWVRVEDNRRSEIWVPYLAIAPAQRKLARVEGSTIEGLRIARWKLEEAGFALAPEPSEVERRNRLHRLATAARKLPVYSSENIHDARRRRDSEYEKLFRETAAWFAGNEAAAAEREREACIEAVKHIPGAAAAILAARDIETPEAA